MLSELPLLKQPYRVSVNIKLEIRNEVETIVMFHKGISYSLVLINAVLHVNVTRAASFSDFFFSQQAKVSAVLYYTWLL